MSTIKEERAVYYRDQIKGRSTYLIDLISKDSFYFEIDADAISKGHNPSNFSKQIRVDQDEVLMAIGDLETALKELRKLVK